MEWLIINLLKIKIEASYKFSKEKYFRNKLYSKTLISLKFKSEKHQRKVVSGNLDNGIFM